MTVASVAELQADYDAALRPQRKMYGATVGVVDAVMYSLRSRGTAALAEPDCLSRLAELNAEQMRAVAVRLQKLKSHIATAWGVEQIETLLQTKARI